MPPVPCTASQPFLSSFFFILLSSASTHLCEPPIQRTLAARAASRLPCFSPPSCTSLCSLETYPSPPPARTWPSPLPVWYSSSALALTLLLPCPSCIGVPPVPALSFPLPGTRVPVAPLNTHCPFREPPQRCFFPSSNIWPQCSDCHRLPTLPHSPAQRSGAASCKPSQSISHWCGGASSRSRQS